MFSLFSVKATVRGLASVPVLLALTAGFASADQLSFGAATGYNVFVFNNFSEYGTDAQGKMAVGGNFQPANNGGFTIAGNHAGDGAGVYDLVVGGNFFNTNYSMGGGDIYVGGNMAWHDPSLPHNAYVAGNFTNTSSGGSVGGTVYYGGTYSSAANYLSHQAKSASSMPMPIDFLSAKTNLDSVSASLAADAANGTVSVSYSITGSDANLNIFNLSAGSFSGATINITAPAGSTVIVNVPGGADSFANGSINLNGVSASNVIFNFNSATTLALSGIAFNGTILAPYADFTGSWGQINGQLIADSASGTTQLNEVLFTGKMGSISAASSQVQSTPEPSTWLLLLTGAGAVVLLRSRQTAATRLPDKFQRRLNDPVVALGRSYLTER
jgi:choice-of-anchor A domain-containing protein